MKIFDAAQIRQWDSYTIAQEPITSLDLMERAASQCVDWLEEHIDLERNIVIVAGKGNNGGDGLAIGRMLSLRDCRVAVFILEFGHLGTEDFQANLERLHQYPGVEIKYIQSVQHFPALTGNELVVDALFGSGLNRPLDGVTAELVEHINGSGCDVISIDVPSGLPADHSARDAIVVKATHTLSFQVFKLAFLMDENAVFVGQLHLLDIGLHPGFYGSTETNFEIVDKELISSIYRPRNSAAHKGKFGHALVVAGSYGKIGAALLCSDACLKAGAGLTTTHIPKCGYEILQTALPEVMVMTDFNSSIITKIESDLQKFDCIGIGPGIGIAGETKKALVGIFNEFRNPVILDADALNILAGDPSILKSIPSNSVLTPHPKEFDRVFGKSANDFERLQQASRKSKELDVIIILKGHHTAISTPGGRVYFNSTGNAGMAKGGSGDALTGIITGLVCQQYTSIQAAILGVYLHGMAGDLAAEKHSEEAMTTRDLLDNIGQAFLKIRGLEDPLTWS